MGLFGKRNTDDYISPFDVGQAPDYIDPSTVVDRESKIDAKQHQREERRRKAEKRAERRRQERIEQAYYHTSQPSTSQPSTASSTPAAVPASKPSASTTPPPSAYPKPNIPPSQPAGSARPTTNPVVNAANRADQPTKKPLAAQLGIVLFLLAIASLLGNSLGVLIVIGAVVYLIHAIRTRQSRTANGAGRPTSPASRPPAATAARSSTSNRAATVIVTVTVTAIIVVAAAVIGVVMAQRNTVSDTSRGSFSWSADDEDDYDYTEKEPETFERTGTLIDEYDDERMSFTIARAYAGIHDDFDARTVIVEVEASNEGSATTSLGSIGELEVFQNGVALRDSFLYVGDDASLLPGYDPVSSINDIPPGGRSTITVAYALRDTTTPLDVRITDYSDTATIRSAFAIGEDTPTSPFEQIDSSELPQIPTPTDTEGMSTIRDWDDTALAEVRIDDIQRGTPTYEGIDTVIVTYRWINRSDEIRSLSQLGDIQAFLDDTELEDAYLSEPVEGFEESSEYLALLPGAQTTATLAYELPRTTGTVNARIVDYDDTVLVERSYELE